MLTVPLAFAVAAVSWHVVEQPAQALRFVPGKIDAGLANCRPWPIVGHAVTRLIDGRRAARREA